MTGLAWKSRHPCLALKRRIRWRCLGVSWRFIAKLFRIRLQQAFFSFFNSILIFNDIYIHLYMYISIDTSLSLYMYELVLYINQWYLLSGARCPASDGRMSRASSRTDFNWFKFKTARYVTPLRYFVDPSTAPLTREPCSYNPCSVQLSVPTIFCLTFVAFYGMPCHV